MKGLRQLRFADSVEPSIHNLNAAPPPPRDEENIGAPLSPPPPPSRKTAAAATTSPTILHRKQMTPTTSPVMTTTTRKAILSPIAESPLNTPVTGEKESEPVKHDQLDEHSSSSSVDDQIIRSLYETNKEEQDSNHNYPMSDDSHSRPSEGMPASLIPFHRQIYEWYKENRPSMEQVSTWIARNAPCFWCRCWVPRLDTSSVTDRSILFRLNVLCAFFALMQVGSAIFLIVVLFAKGIADRGPVNRRDENERNSIAVNLWNNNGTVFFTGIMGGVIFITMIATLKNVKHVNLIGSVRYMWALLWFLPIESLLIISLFDFHRVTDVWVRHYWNAGTMAWFRDKFCAEGTSRTLCVVPVCGLPEFGQDTALPGGGNNTSCQDGELRWCRTLYDASNCTAIRNHAQEQMETTSYLYSILNGVWGVLLILLLCLTVYRLQSIITKPIVQRSREANVPGWLMLPIVGCAVTGCILLFSDTSVLSSGANIKPSWIGIAYLASAALFAVAAMLGWLIAHFSVLNSRDLKTKSAAVFCFIVTMLVTSMLVAAIFAASIAYSVDLVDFPISDSQRGTIACFIDSAESCSFCNATVFPEIIRECPQWTSEEVVKVLRTQLKSSAVLAGIVLLYSFGTLRFGFVLRRHVSQYQIDYV